MGIYNLAWHHVQPTAVKLKPLCLLSCACYCLRMRLYILSPLSTVVLWLGYYSIHMAQTKNLKPI